MRQARKQNPVPLATGRLLLMSVALLCAFAGIFARVLYLQVDEAAMLVDQSISRSERTQNISTHRGLITDRNGQELARSVPVKSVWMDVSKTLEESPLLQEPDWVKLAAVLERKPDEFKRWIHSNAQKQFVWLARQLDPERAAVVSRLQLPGVYLRNEWRRYYPAAEITAHLVGFTNVDDVGQEGIEKNYDHWLAGKPGREKVLLDLKRRVIEKQQMIEAPQKGKDLALSIDGRIQALAYKALKKAVLKHRAKAGALVMLDVTTGEVLALVSQPSYNPNRIEERKPGLTRNRAMTDSFEPGSTAKPFTVASALEAKRVRPETVINTAPGRVKLNGYWVKDNGRNHGRITVTEILKKSSNVGVAKLALQMSDEEFLRAFYQVGFGQVTGSGFPGESAGKFSFRPNWSDIEKATVAYGYGFRVTPIQLAQAYAVLAAGGKRYPVSLVRLDKPPVAEQVMSPQVARQVVTMMETVVDEGGTGHRAQIAGYRIAGKTGTARKAVAGGYGDEYSAFFAGIAPVSAPRIAMVVFIDEPRSEDYYGGQIAAPVFADVAQQALRLLNVKPDRLIDIANKQSRGDNHHG